MMNTNNFKILVEALEGLPQDVRDNKVNMTSTDEPRRGASGCFAGVISIVAKDIPELKDLYAYKTNYYFSGWVDALNSYLNCSFRVWALYNKSIWGNPRGVNMFNSVTAFGKNHGDTLTHDDIIVHLRGVYERWIKFENKSNEFQYPNKGDMEP